MTIFIQTIDLIVKMSLFSFKKIGKKEYKLDGDTFFITTVVSFIFLFIVISLSSGSWETGLIWAFTISVIVGIYCFILNLIGEKKHKSIHFNKLFQSLKSNGFDTEKHGEYVGLIKTMENRAIRIYYDWNKTLTGFLSFGDIVVEIPYLPIVIDYDNFEVDKVRVKNLNRKLEKTEYGFKRYLTWNKMILCFNYYPWTNSKMIINKINHNLEILNNESLMPLNVKPIDPKIKELEDRGWYLPSMELIWDALEN